MSSVEAWTEEQARRARYAEAIVNAGWPRIDHDAVQLAVTRVLALVEGERAELSSPSPRH